VVERDCLVLVTRFELVVPRRFHLVVWLAEQCHVEQLIIKPVLLYIHTFTFAVPRTRTRLGDRAFAVAGPQIWNSLAADLRLVENYARFRRLLKGHMFG